MALFINPVCANNLYTLDTVELAQECGKLSGYFTSSVLSIITVLIFSLLWYSSDKITNSDGSKTTSPDGKYHRYLFIMIIVLIFIWICIPWFSGWLNSISWKGYDAQIKGYEKQGFTRSGAIDKIQSFHQNQIQADATRTGASTIAAALFASRK